MEPTTTASTKPYLPEGIQYTGTIDVKPRHLLLCSMPGDGKTFQSITTAPNPVYVAIEQGIQDPRLVKLNVPMYPLFDVDFCTKVIKKTQIHNAVLDFIKVEGPKFSSEQTLIFDSLTTLKDHLHEYAWKRTVLETKAGQDPDGYAYWDIINDYWIDLFKQIDRLKCNVIVTAHLREVLGKQNNLMYYAPIIEGQYKTRIGQKFSDVVRIITKSKKDGEKVITSYQWQVKPDDLFPMAKSRSAIDTFSIPADFRELLKV